MLCGLESVLHFVCGNVRASLGDMTDQSIGAAFWKLQRGQDDVIRTHSSHMSRSRVVHVDESGGLTPSWQFLLHVFDQQDDAPHTCSDKQARYHVWE